MTTTNAQLMFATQNLDASISQKLVMTTIDVLLIIVMQLLDARTFQSLVMIILIVLLIHATLFLELVKTKLNIADVSLNTNVLLEFAVQMDVLLKEIIFAVKTFATENVLLVMLAKMFNATLMKILMFHV
jgi:hypothetical protein